MSIEVEIKAWVKNASAVDAKMAELCRFVRDYVKEDLYFHGPKVDERQRDVRIRSDGDAVICTFKDKTLQNGLEVNDETEFTVSDARGLEKLLRALGCVPFLRKVKRGRAYARGELVIEISDVEGLGRFIEVERILADVTNVAEAERDIRGLLNQAGIREEDIEARPYLVMLKNLQTGNAAE